jgi:hypothetical protein
MRRRAVAAVAPVAVSAFAVVGGASGAGAAAADRTENFTFVSKATQEEVNCTIAAGFASTERSSGKWGLTAYVRISSASSSECFDGVASLAAHHASDPDDQFDGAGSYLEVSTTTPTEVTSISYEIYFNACACYTPEYVAPK